MVFVLSAIDLPSSSSGLQPLSVNKHGAMARASSSGLPQMQGRSEALHLMRDAAVLKQPRAQRGRELTRPTRSVEVALAVVPAVVPESVWARTGAEAMKIAAAGRRICICIVVGSSSREFVVGEWWWRVVRSLLVDGAKTNWQTVLGSEFSREGKDQQIEGSLE